MAFSKCAFLACILLVLASFAWADTASCSADSFREACANCQFDANGKMNEECWKGYQQNGVGCIAKEYPATSVVYSQGNCPEIDRCASQLKACVSASPTFSDKEDCSNTEVRDCYWYSDQCVKEAQYKCDPIGVDSICSTILLPLLLAFGGAYASFKTRK